MGHFTGINKVEVGNTYAYIEEGDLTLKINNVQLKETRDKGDSYIVDFEVLQSNNEGNPVGSKPSWYQSIIKKDIAFGQITKFLEAATNTSIKDEHREDLAEASIASDQPLRGKVVRVKAENVISKAGGTYTRVKFFPSLHSVK